MAVVVEGLGDLIRVSDECDKKTKKYVRDRLRESAEPVRLAAAAKFARYNPGDAGRYRTVVRRTGVIAVEQPRRRTTGLRPDYGQLQYSRALIPGLVENTERVTQSIYRAMDEINQFWGRGG